MSNLNINSNEWLKELFDSEYCACCGGDDIHHEAIPFNGNLFARCKYPENEDGTLNNIIQNYRHPISKGD